MMKNTTFLGTRSFKLCTVAMAMAIGFSMAACPTDSDGSNNGGGSVYLGGGDGNPVEVLGEQVYTVTMNQANYSYTPYTGSLAVGTGESGLVSAAAITNGKLKYTLGIPSTLSGLNVTDMGMNYDDVTVSRDGVNITVFMYLPIEGSPDYDYAFKGNRSVSVNTANNTGTMTYDSVMFFYVDNDVTMTGKGRTSTGTEDGRTYIDKYNDINLTLKKGWNAIHNKTVMVMTETSETSTFSISLGNPSSCKWVLAKFDD